LKLKDAAFIEASQASFHHYWRIPMNPSFPNKGSPPIEGIAMEAKQRSERNLPFLTCMMASKELLNLHFLL